VLGVNWGAAMAIAAVAPASGALCWLYGSDFAKKLKLTAPDLREAEVNCIVRRRGIRARIRRYFFNIAIYLPLLLKANYYSALIGPRQIESNK